MVTWIIAGASVAMLIGGLVYLREMIWGKTRPNRVTWFLWGLAPIIGAAAAWQDGVHWQVWLPVLVIGIGPMIVVVVSLFQKNGYWQLGPLDYACGFFAVLALLLWAITQDPLLAVILALVSDSLAALPTLIKSWKFPETETAITYLLTAVASATGLLALERGDFIEWAFPAYLAGLNLGVALIIYYRRTRAVS